MAVTLAEVGNYRLAIGAFQQWATGNLVENRNRGIFAEWLVGQALGVIAEGEHRQEWDEWDLTYGPSESRIEVKAAGRGQTWLQDKPSIPRFDITRKRWRWDPSDNKRIECSPPARLADAYVFCLHVPERPTNENVIDPMRWDFWVVSGRKLDDELSPQKSVGLVTLDRLAKRIPWSDIKPAVDGCMEEVRR